MLSSIFNSNDDLNTLTKRFIKKLDGCIKINFRRVRVNKLKETEQEKLYKKLRILKEKMMREAEKLNNAFSIFCVSQAHFSMERLCPQVTNCLARIITE